MTRFHRGVLPVGDSYTESISFQVPHAIYGTFFFVVVTDDFDDVYENTFENDNTNSTQVDNWFSYLEYITYSRILKISINSCTCKSTAITLLG